MKIYFPLLETDLDVSSEQTVAQVCEMAGVPLNLVCGGKGSCKKCIIRIKEKGVFSEVLACQYPVSDGMEIYLSKERAASQILEVSANKDLPFHPSVKCYPLNYSDLNTPLGTYDMDVIRRLLPERVKPLSYTALKRLEATYFLEDYTYLNVVVEKDQIIDFVPSQSPLVIYGIAFDIGTTSVVGYLYNMNSGCLVTQYSMLNKQIAFGGDVISRIDYASASEAHLKKIQQAILDTIAEIIENLKNEAQIDESQIYQTVYCGNSTMCHLFLGINPIHLGMAPFIGYTKDAVSLPAAELHLPLNPRGTVTFLPLLGGFVGADTAAVLLSLPRDGKMRMMIDLGTNGEIAVGHAKRYFVASTACGPALEGAGITMGMRGTTGAIEKVNCENGKIHVSVIGNTAPKGFCGSGIIDTIAMLLKEGLIADKGNFIKGDALEQHPMKARFGTDENNQRYFIIVTADENPEGRDIIITQKDIRAVQLAKAAIYTGCCLLMENYGIRPKELTEIVIAGAFGNYIDIEHAQYIGLLPEIEGVPVRSIGNGAGTGSQLFLLSEEEAAACAHLTEVTTHIELATDPNFTNTYMMNTIFRSELME